MQHCLGEAAMKAKFWHAAKKPSTEFDLFF